MAFMISKETENVQSSEEIELAFRAITNQVSQYKQSIKGAKTEAKSIKSCS